MVEGINARYFYIWGWGPRQTLGTEENSGLNRRECRWFHDREEEDVTDQAIAMGLRVRRS